MRWLSRYNQKQRAASKQQTHDGTISFELDDLEYIWDRPLQ